MEAALALAGPLLALARKAEEKQQQQQQPPIDPGREDEHDEDAADEEPEPTMDRRALLRRRLRALGDEDAQSLVRLLEARMLAPPSAATTGALDPHAQLPSASDLLHTLLAAPRTALPSIGACVGLVAQGRLSGRQAVLCVSAIREALSTDLALAVMAEVDEDEQEDDEEAEAESAAAGPSTGSARRRRATDEPPRPQPPTETQLRRRAALLGELRALCFTAVNTLLPDGDGGEEGDRRQRLRLAEAGPGRLNDFALIIDVAWPLLLLAQRLEDALRLWAAAAARRRRQQRGRRRVSGEKQQEQQQDGDGQQGLEEEGSGRGADWEPPLLSIGEEVATAVVGRPWPVPLTLPLLGLCRDMHEFLADEEVEGQAQLATWGCVRRQIARNACPPLTPVPAKAQADAARGAAEKLLTSDGAGLMRQCLLLAEAHARRASTTGAAAGAASAAASATAGVRRSSSSSGATQRPSAATSNSPWLSLFRRLYHATPPEALATTELVLEQCLRQALPCVGLLARDLEARLQAPSQPHEPAGPDGVVEAGVCWRDVALLLLLRRTVAGWPLSSLLASAAAVAAGGDGRRSGNGSGGALDLACSHRLLDGLLLALLLRLAARAAAAVAVAAAADAASASSATTASKKQVVVAPPSMPLILAGVRRAVEAVVTHGVSGGLDDDGGHAAPMLYQQQRRRRLCLGRLSMQRASQLFEACMAWLRDAERACHDFDRQWPASASLKATDLRALAAAATSALYGAVPEGQSRVLSALLGAIVEHSGSQQDQQQQQAEGPTTLALTPAGAGLVRALAAVTAEWPATLRQHTAVFQHLVARLPKLPSPLACAVVRASAPLATACPAYLDALLAVVRKCIVRADVAGRAFGMAALTALLAVSASAHANGGTGLLARADRGEEVAAMFDSLLGLALPLPLKARLYRAIADAAASSSGGAAAASSMPGLGGGRMVLGMGSSSSSSSASASSMHMTAARRSNSTSSAAVPLLRASMGRRLARFVDRDTGRLSPLSLFEECRRAGGANGGGASSSSAPSASSPIVALRDDLPELLRCVLSLNAAPEAPRHHGGKAPSPLSARLARLVLGAAGAGMGLEMEEETDPDVAWAGRVLEGVVAFLRDGAPMEGEQWPEDENGEAFGGHGFGEQRGRRLGRRGRKGSVLPPCCPDSVSAGEKLHLLLALVEALLDAALASSEEAPYEAVMELYRLHGMLSDMAQALGVKPRAQRPAMDGVERAVPLLRMEGAAAFLRLVWARQCGGGSKGPKEVVDGQGDEQRPAGACAACGEARRRFALWAVQHAALSCQRALEATAGAAAAAGGVEEEQLPAPVDGGGGSEAEANADAYDGGVEASAVSPAALLPVLLDLYAAVPTAFAPPASAAAAAMEEEKVPEEGMDDDPVNGGCPHCQAAQKATALKQQAAALATAAAPADASSKLRRRGPALAAQAAWRQAAGKLPLAAAFLAGVDAKARRVVEEEVEVSGEDPEAAVLEVRVALLDLIRAVVARLGAVPQHGTNMDPPSVGDTPMGAAPAGLLPFIDTLATELGAGLVADGGLPLRLVQAYLDLLEALIDRLPPACPTPHPPPTKKDEDRSAAFVLAKAYNAWRLALARRLLCPLARTRVSQPPILRRFVRLALAAAPAGDTVALTDGLMAAGAKYLSEWLREARNAYLRRRRGGGKGDDEVVTAAEARELLEEEGDGELYPDGGEGSDDSDEEEEEEGQKAAGVAADPAAEPEPEESEKKPEAEDEEDKAGKALATELSRLRFASPSCWQAVVLPVLTRWEQLLLLQPPALDGKGYAALLRHLPTFLRPLDVGGQSTIYTSSNATTAQPQSLADALRAAGRGGKKGGKQLRVAAFFLPGPLKLRFLSLLSRLFALARPAAARVGRRLRRLYRRAVAEEEGYADEEEDEASSTAARDADVALVGAYLPLATDLTAAVQAWAGAERQQRGSAGAALRKRLPSVLFALERVDLALQRLAGQCAEHGAGVGPDWLLPVEGARKGGRVETEKAALCPLAARLVRWHHERLAWEEKENQRPASQRKAQAADERSSEEDEEDEEEDDYDLALLTMGGARGQKRKRGKKRLRSRNVVVDRWLAEEGEGDDAFADLEDFIMDDEY